MFVPVLVRACAWLLGSDCLLTGVHLQHDEHPGVDPQGHEDQSHQPSSDGDCSGGHDGDGGVHPLRCPHVPDPGHIQNHGGEGQWNIRVLGENKSFVVFLQLGSVPLVPWKLLHDPAHGVHLVHPGAGRLEADHDQVPLQGSDLLHYAKMLFPPCPWLW